MQERAPVEPVAWRALYHPWRFMPRRPDPGAATARTL